MIDVWTQSYADRIAEGAAQDGMPWTLSRAEALWLASRYGALITLEGSGPWRLREISGKISESLDRVYHTR